jgi:hypothetical protein
VQSADEAGLTRAVQILGQIAHVVRPASGSIDLSGSESLPDAILNVITRHPLQEADLLRATGHWTPGQVKDALAELVAAGRAQIVTRHGTCFWSAAAAHYPDEVSRHHHRPRSAQHVP